MLRRDLHHRSGLIWRPALNTPHPFLAPSLLRSWSPYLPTEPPSYLIPSPHRIGISFKTRIFLCKLPTLMAMLWRDLHHRFLRSDGPHLTHQSPHPHHFLSPFSFASGLTYPIKPSSTFLSPHSFIPFLPRLTTLQIHPHRWSLKINSHHASPFSLYSPDLYISFHPPHPSSPLIYMIWRPLFKTRISNPARWKFT